MTPLPLFRAFWPQRVEQKVKIPGRTAPPGHNGDDDDGDGDDDDMTMMMMMMMMMMLSL